MSEPNSMPTPEEENIVPKNYFSRLGGVYMSPGESFAEIGRAPRLLVPIIVLLIVGGIQGFYLVSNVDVSAIMAQATPQGQIPPEQMALVEPMIKAMIMVSSCIGTLLVTLAIAAVFMLISKIMTVENRFKAVFAVTVYAITAVTIVSFILMVLVISLKGSEGLDIRNMSNILSSSLGAILANLFGNDILPKFFMQLANYVEVFVIWQIVLLSIGYAAVSKKLKTSRVATWLTVLYGIIAVIGAGISSMVG
jgi:hypothetical protein